MTAMKLSSNTIEKHDKALPNADFENSVYLQKMPGKNGVARKIGLVMISKKNRNLVRLRMFSSGELPSL